MTLMAVSPTWSDDNASTDVSSPPGIPATRPTWYSPNVPSCRAGSGHLAAKAPAAASPFRSSTVAPVATVKIGFGVMPATTTTTNDAVSTRIRERREQEKGGQEQSDQEQRTSPRAASPLSSVAIVKGRTRTLTMRRCGRCRKKKDRSHYLDAFSGMSANQCRECREIKQRARARRMSQDGCSTGKANVKNVAADVATDEEQQSDHQTDEEDDLPLADRLQGRSSAAAAPSSASSMAASHDVSAHPSVSTKAAPPRTVVHKKQLTVAQRGSLGAPRPVPFATAGASSGPIDFDAAPATFIVTPFATASNRQSIVCPDCKIRQPTDRFVSDFKVGLTIMCASCRRIRATRKRKRQWLDGKRTLPSSSQSKVVVRKECRQCKESKPIKHFKSKIRRAEPTVECFACREVKRLSRTDRSKRLTRPDRSKAVAALLQSNTAVDEDEAMEDDDLFGDLDELSSENESENADRTDEDSLLAEATVKRMQQQASRSTTSNAPPSTASIPAAERTPDAQHESSHLAALKAEGVARNATTHPLASTTPLSDVQPTTVRRNVRAPSDSPPPVIVRVVTAASAQRPLAVPPAAPLSNATPTSTARPPSAVVPVPVVNSPHPMVPSLPAPLVAPSAGPSSERSTAPSLVSSIAASSSFAIPAAQSALPSVFRPAAPPLASPAAPPSAVQARPSTSQSQPVVSSSATAASHTPSLSQRMAAPRHTMPARHRPSLSGPSSNQHHSSSSSSRAIPQHQQADIARAEVVAHRLQTTDIPQTPQAYAALAGLSNATALDIWRAHSSAERALMAVAARRFREHCRVAAPLQPAFPATIALLHTWIDGLRFDHSVQPLEIQEIVAALQHWHVDYEMSTSAFSPCVQKRIRGIIRTASANAPAQCEGHG